ncbi:MAG: beta-ketoacyl synthase N-terminal-like domain-containing protein [Candidatus Obscuribacterales bacterium]
MTRPAVAIIGMSALFPGAADLTRYWANLVNGVDSIRDVSPNEWDASRYGQNTAGLSAPPPPEKAFQHSYMTRAGFITEFADFDPLKYGVMPNSIPGTDPDQLLALRLALDAMADAGYATREFEREKAQVILGRTMAPSVGAMNLIQNGQTVAQVLDALHALCPQYTRDDLHQIELALRASLKQCNADTIPGVMPNVIAGRIASKLGFQGRNLVLDAACASSLIAVEMGVRDLLSLQADLVVAGGIHINSCAYFFQMFCGLGAVSRAGVLRPFDERADGTLLGEGAGILVMKRLQDAIADGDRVYATIIGVGSSSDGAGTSVLAPSVDGEALAIERALEMAQVSPSSIALLEAHGTGTTAGDLAELQAIAQAWRGEAKGSWCALGSVKSMIGHCQAASGAAGLIKTALALHEKVLPPTLHVEKPLAKVGWDRHPCYINSRTRPWIHPAAWDTKAQPRRAAVSAFGFGGINAHVVLEEAPDDRRASYQFQSKLHAWDSELIVLNADSPEALSRKAHDLWSFVEAHENVDLKDLAFSWNFVEPNAKMQHRAALIVRSREDILQKLSALAEELSKRSPRLDGNLTGIYYRNPDSATRGKMAFLLPGLGSAYTNMLADLCAQFPVVREVFDYVDFLAVQNGELELPSTKIFPRTASGDDPGALAKMDAAVVTVLMVEFALSELLRSLEIEPDILLGCSTGEFAAITMSGSIDVLSAASQFYGLSVAVARAVPEERLEELRTMRVFADYEAVEPLLKQVSNPVFLSSYLAPQHVILTGSEEAMKQCSAVLKQNSVDFHFLPIAIPYHTELVKDSIDTSQKEFRELTFTAPSKTAWLCSTAGEMPRDPDAIRRITTELFSKPIKLRETIERMYAEGVRVFVEVGPKGGLTTLVGDILADKEHVAVASNLAGRPAVTQIHHMLAQLFVQGVHMNLLNLYSKRAPHSLDLSAVTAPPSRTQKLDLKYPELKLDPQFTQGMAAKLAAHVYSQPAPSTVAYAEPQTGYAAAAPAGYAAESLPVSAGGSEAVAQYLQTMAGFHQQLMSVQGQVFHAYMGQTGGQVESSGLPFLRGTIRQLAEGQIDVIYLLTLNEDQYLLDHAIGGTVRQLFGFGERVHLLPLMVALEIMAEAASMLCTNKAVVKVENVRASERIRVGAEGFAVRAIAALAGENRVQVQLWRGNDETTDAMMSCDVVFADGYPPLPQATTAVLPEARPAQLAGADLYTPHTMFHGPRMQAVSRLTAVAPRAIAGEVTDRQPQGWFGSLQSPLFLLNPLLLDNASQLVLFHLFEQQVPVIALLPFYIESIEFFAYPNLQDLVYGRAQLHAITERGTQASVEVANADGKLLLRLNNISSRRIALDQNWLNFVHDPSSQSFSQPAPELLSHMSLPSYGEAAICEQSVLSADPVVVDWCADYLLTEPERALWRAHAREEQRKAQWLLGRIAAKEAVCKLVMRHSGVRLLDQDVEIIYDESGRPVISPLLAQVLGWAPWISIAHSDDVAVAVAINSEYPIGVDLQMIAPRDQEFIEFAFSEGEQNLFSAVTGADRDRLVAQLWCAKEALAKALGTGFQGAFRNGFVVEKFDAAGGEAIVATTINTQYGAQPYRCPVATRVNERYATALCVMLNPDEAQLSRP